MFAGRRLLATASHGGPKGILPLMLATLLAMIAFARVATFTVYVSPEGSDSASGTSKAPVQGLEQALSIIHSKRKDVSESAEIEILAGDYPVKETLHFETADSNLIVRGAPGTRLFGGSKLFEWKPLRDQKILDRINPSARDHILTCDVSADPQLGKEGPEDPISSLDLVFDHVPMNLPRWPSAGIYGLTGAPEGPQSFQFRLPEVENWTPTADIWAVGYWFHDYNAELSPVTVSNGSVVVKGKLPTSITQGRRFYFLNVLEELNSPGEFYFDRSAHEIYLYPPTNPAGHEIFVERLKTPMFLIKDSSHLTFEGMNFEGGRSSVGKIDGGDHVVFQNCKFRDFGGSGLSFSNSPDSGVVSSELSGLGGSGVLLEAGERKTLTAGGDFVESNLIFNFARWFRTYNPAVGFGGVGNRVRHNEIHDAPGNAIIWSGNDQLVEANEIYRVCTEAGDAGAVYGGRDPSYRGFVIKNNRFHDIKPLVKGFGDVSCVYLDDRLSGATVFGNIFERTGTAVVVGGGRDNKILNNIFLGCSTAIYVDQRGKSWQAGKPVETSVNRAKEVLSWGPVWSQKYPDLLALVRSDDPGAAVNNDVSSNISAGSTFFLKVVNGLTFQDVGNRNNVTLASGSLKDALAHAPNGFASIPINTIGPSEKN